MRNKKSTGNTRAGANLALAHDARAYGDAMRPHRAEGGPSGAAEGGPAVRAPGRQRWEKTDHQDDVTHTRTFICSSKQRRSFATERRVCMGCTASKPGLTYEEKLALWRKLGGGDLEPVLASGAIALVDSRWIINYAEAGGVLTHRQALPKDAFITFTDLVKGTESEFGLPIAAISYPWLTKDHPDQEGKNLRRVAQALKAMDEEVGVFWDYMSLHQHPDPVNGVMRTEAENALFKQGLGCLGTLYSHPHTWVLRLTSFPDGHKAEDQAEGTNVAKYFDRGWCATENAWASLTKAGHLSLDLGKMRAGVEYGYSSLRVDCTQDGGRRPPLLPSAFAAELEKKSFTNGKDDKPLVKRLYEAAFEEQFGKATVLNYASLGWGDAEAAQLAEVLASGAAPRLEKLYLSSNKIGEQGCKALAAALGKEGAAPRLEMLALNGNQIGDEGCKALAASLKDGAAPSLKARDAPRRHMPSPPNAHRTSPRAVPLSGQRAIRAEGRVRGAPHQAGLTLEAGRPSW